MIKKYYPKSKRDMYLIDNFSTLNKLERTNNLVWDEIPLRKILLRRIMRLFK